MEFKNTTNKKKILLAEDDSAVRRFIEIVLRRGGFEVFVAEDGMVAMKIASETIVDAVVSDAIMPNLSGYDLCRIMRQSPDYKTIPFIILSGVENQNDAVSADAYLMKGESLKDELLDLLQNLLAKIK